MLNFRGQFNVPHVEAIAASIAEWKYRFHGQEQCTRLLESFLSSFKRSCFNFFFFFPDGIWNKRCDLLLLTFARFYFSEHEHTDDGEISQSRAELTMPNTSVQFFDQK